MSIKFEITKQNNIHFGIAAVAAALVGYFTSASWWVILLFAAVYFGLVNVKLELPVKLSWLWAAMLLVIGAILSVFSVQYVLLTDEDFVKTTDMVCVVNVVLALAIYLVILFITNNTRLTCTIASIAILAFGFIDYFVYEFRGNEFTYADLKSAGTGLSVVTKYKFVIDYKFLYVILAAVLLVVSRELMRDFNEYSMLMLGGLMVLMMIWRPQGLLPMTRPQLKLKNGAAKGEQA